MTSDLGADLDLMGPVDCLIVEFPRFRPTGEVLAAIIDLVDRGIVRIIDLVFIQKDPDGTVAVMRLADLDGDDQLDVQIFEGASSGLVGSEDIAIAGDLLEPDSAAGILIYENAWAIPVATALRRAGGQLVASERIPIPAVLAALDEAEAVTA